MSFLCYTTMNGSYEGGFKSIPMITVLKQTDKKKKSLQFRSTWSEATCSYDIHFTRRPSDETGRSPLTHTPPISNLQSIIINHRTVPSLRAAGMRLIIMPTVWGGGGLAG